MRIRALSVFEGVVYHCYATDTRNPCRPTLEVDAITREFETMVGEMVSSLSSASDFSLSRSFSASSLSACLHGFQR